MPPQKIVRIVRGKQQVPPHQSNYSQPTYSRPVEKKEEYSGCLCAFLGGFGPIGMVVAAIIGKQGGVIAALIGWVVSWLIIGLAWFLILGGVAFLSTR